MKIKKLKSDYDFRLSLCDQLCVKKLFEENYSDVEGLDNSYGIEILYQNKKNPIPSVFGWELLTKNLPITHTRSYESFMALAKTQEHADVLRMYCENIKIKNAAYVNTELHPGVAEWLKENGLAYDTGKGTERYPLYQFSKSWLKSLKPVDKTKTYRLYEETFYKNSEEDK